MSTAPDTTAMTPANGTTRLPAHVERLSTFLDGLSARAMKVISKHVTAERVTQLFLAEAARQPELYECMTTPQGQRSIATFFMLSSQLGLEPGSALGLIYPTTRNLKDQSGGKHREVVPIVGYRGYCELARRSGEIAAIAASPFYDDEIKKNLVEVNKYPPSVVHRWSPDVVPSTETLVGAYAVVELKNGSKAIVVMNRAQIEAVRQRSPAKNNGPWVSDFDAMARKTVLRALLKNGTVPLSTELRTALHDDEDDDQPEERPNVVDVTPEPAKLPQTGRDDLRQALGIETKPAEANPLAALQLDVATMESALLELGGDDRLPALREAADLKTEAGLQAYRSKLSGAIDAVATPAGGAS